MALPDHVLLSTAKAPEADTCQSLKMLLLRVARCSEVQVCSNMLQQQEPKIPAFKQGEAKKGLPIRQLFLLKPLVALQEPGTSRSSRSISLPQRPSQASKLHVMQQVGEFKFAFS